MPPPSGFGIALALLIVSVLLILAPRYLGVPRDSFVALGFYAIATVVLMLTVLGLGRELSNPNISAFLRELFFGELPSSLWGSPSSNAWVSAGITMSFLLPLGFLHLIAPRILGLRGVVGLIAKSLTLVLASFCAFLVSLGFALTIDELLIKPFLVTPAANLAEGQMQVSGESSTTSSAGNQPQDQPEENTGWFLTFLSKVVAIVFYSERA
jgi:hypothetical protein